MRIRRVLTSWQRLFGCAPRYPDTTVSTSTARPSGRLKEWRRRSLGACVVLGSAIISYAGVSIWSGEPDSIPAAFRISNKGARRAPVNPFASANGTHLIGFVVTASDCGWSTRPEGMDAIRTIRARMRSMHGGAYAQVSTIGVALDKDIDAGLRFLSKLGEGKPSGAFDQIVVGGSWLNEQIVRFVWRERVTEARLPQVLVIERPVNTQSYLLTYRIGVEGDTVVANPGGMAEIITWLKQGAPLNKPLVGATGR